jgi:hypothetical protein
VNLEYVDKQFVEPCGPTEKKLKTTVALPCDLEANNNVKHDDESGVELVPGPSQDGISVSSNSSGSRIPLHNKP